MSSLRQELNSYHPNVFTVVSPFVEGRVFIAWEPSNNNMLHPSPSEMKSLSLLPGNFSLCFYSSIILPNASSLFIHVLQCDTILLLSRNFLCVWFKIGR